MKKLLKFLGIGILSIVAILGVFFAYLSFNDIDKEKIFIPYIHSSIPILTTWEKDKYQSLLTEKSIESLKPEQWDLYLVKISNLGKLKSIGTPELKGSSSRTGGNGTYNYATYLVPLTFDTGLAHVELTLVYHDEKVKIHQVRYLSDLLMK